MPHYQDGFLATICEDLESDILSIDTVDALFPVDFLLSASLPSMLEPVMNSRIRGLTIWEPQSGRDRNYNPAVRGATLVHNRL